MQTLTIAVLIMAVACVCAGPKPKDNCCFRADVEQGNGRKVCYDKLLVGNTPEPEPCQGQTFSCFRDPCKDAKCDGCADAVCVQNYCVPCGVDFYLQHGVLGNIKVDCSKHAYIS